MGGPNVQTTKTESILPKNDYTIRMADLLLRERGIDLKTADFKQVTAEQIKKTMNSGRGQGRLDRDASK